MRTRPERGSRVAEGLGVDIQEVIGKAEQASRPPLAGRALYLASVFEIPKMKAILINPETRSIESVDINGRDDIARLVGFNTLESDTIGTAGDRLYFDEECFLRGTTGRFQIDTIIPVSGKGVIVGTAGDGSTLRDAVTDIEELRSRIKYL